MVLQTIEIVSHSLMYLQVVLDVKKKNMPETSLIDFIMDPGKVITMLWFSKNCLILFIFCYCVDKFYYHMRRVEEICCTALKPDVPVSGSRRLCKNVRRCTRARFTALHACGVRVGARLPPRLAALLANYFAVVLQFNSTSLR